MNKQRYHKGSIVSINNEEYIIVEECIYYMGSIPIHTAIPIYEINLNASKYNKNEFKHIYVKDTYETNTSIH